MSEKAIKHKPQEKPEFTQQTKDDASLVFLIIFFVIIAVVVFFIANNSSNSSTPSSDSSQTTQQPAQQSQPTTQGVAPSDSSKSWHAVTNFSGKGNKNTESFSIKGNEVKITAKTQSWSAVGSYSAIDLKKDTGGYLGTGLSISTQGTEVGTADTIYRNLDSGDYYISVISGVSWQVSVEEYY